MVKRSFAAHSEAFKTISNTLVQQLWVQLVDSYVAYGDYRGAEHVQKHLLRTFSKHMPVVLMVKAHAKLAMIYRKNGDPKKAAQHLMFVLAPHRAWAIPEGSRNYRLLLAQCYRELKMEREMLSSYREVSGGWRGGRGGGGGGGGGGGRERERERGEERQKQTQTQTEIGIAGTQKLNQDQLQQPKGPREQSQRCKRRVPT